MIPLFSTVCCILKKITGVDRLLSQLVDDEPKPSVPSLEKTKKEAEPVSFTVVYIDYIKQIMPI
jgi:hypothetical protein